MSTIGHPLSDLINLITPYLLTDANGVRQSLQFQEGTTPGLPTQQELIRWYTEVSGYDPRADLVWGSAFGFFRATCIYQGIAARYAVRQASSAKAKDNAERRHYFAQLAWNHFQQARAMTRAAAKL
jgi:aminoglycoside phosphotransferase (APT) family kinase protein